MKHTSKYLTIVLGILAALSLVVPASAQTNTLYTTTLASQQLQADHSICLASATNIVLPSNSQGGSMIYVDHEAEQVLDVSTYSNTCFVVMRSSAPAQHSSGAKAWFGPQQWFGAIDPLGGINSPCTITALYAYPDIVPSTQTIWYCVDSQWVNGVPEQVSNVPYTFFTTLSNPGNLIAATSVTDTAGGEYASQIFIPANVTLTGACWLNAGTVGTDKRLAILWDASGAVVANTATAGVTVAGASQYQCAAWTSTVSVVGPATYYVGVQTAGTTATFYAYATGGAPTNYGTSLTTGTFGTVTAITAPTTFTTAQGPLMMVY